jgi:hypothetical protein
MDLKKTHSLSHQSVKYGHESHETQNKNHCAGEDH